jgi:hypothetical protein
MTFEFNFLFWALKVKMLCFCSLFNSCMRIQFLEAKNIAFLHVKLKIHSSIQDTACDSKYTEKEKFAQNLISCSIKFRQLENVK